MIHNNSTWFTAVLKDSNGKQLATGQASILLEQKAVNFTGEFVPLCPLQEEMEIVRIDEKGKEVHRFVGKVYLSDKTLIRIVEVDDTLLPGSEYIYCDNLPFTGVLEPLPSPQTIIKRVWPFKKEKSNTNLNQVMVPIIELTDGQLVFLFDSSRAFQEGDQFHLTAHMPLILPKTVIEVEKAIIIGVNASYLCKFIDLPQESQQILRHFLVQYNIKHNKLF